ncbi:phage distal tail protein [Nonomuraea sp. NPDC050536]|uniref:phage distal tail protein n=1 Tax=Nonomuraea sp. NPDC050536 TaxID=3364366 RepID=UPI0037C6B3D3
MARAGRGIPNRPRVLKGRFTLQVNQTLAPFETISEWPTITVTTPNANIFLPIFETTSEWPALTLAFDQNLTLPVFETVSEWPDLTVTTPVVPGAQITKPGQVEWNFTLWGEGTDVDVLIPVEGWRDLPQVDNLNVPRPAQHGAWDGRKLAQQRIVTLRLQPNSASDPTLIDDLLAQIDAVTGLPDDDTPLPLVIRGYGDPHLAYGQVIGRTPPMDGDYNVGLPTVTVLIACADPRRYNVQRTGVVLPVGVQVALGNAGNASTHPTIRVDGPATNPTVANAATGRSLSFALTLTTGQQLVIDAFNGNATVDGDSVMSTLTGTSSPVFDFTLQPGSNPVTYTATSGGGNNATILYRDAWI